jgi:hypothetical protein
MSRWFGNTENASRIIRGLQNQRLQVTFPDVLEISAHSGGRLLLEKWYLGLSSFLYGIIGNTGMGVFKFADREMQDWLATVARARRKRQSNPFLVILVVFIAFSM